MRSGSIGIREAKAQLSRLVKEVEQGNEWIITDRGRAVAKLVPMSAGPGTTAERIELLQRWGWIDRSSGGRPVSPPLAVPGGAAQEALQRDRDGR